MSEHEKQVKRERRKADHSRRRGAQFRHPTSRFRHRGAAALAAAGAIAAGTQAYAAPVRSDNPAGPGHFDWVPNELLDVLGDAASQPPLTLVAGVFHQADYYGYGNAVVGGASGALERVTPAGGASYLIPVSAGDSIPSASPNWGGAFVEFYGTSFLPEGVQTYLGIRFDQGAGNQYGWIGVVMNAQFELDAFAWGYETEPGVPIAAGAPEPGSLAVLALGAFGALKRRRR